MMIHFKRDVPFGSQQRSALSRPTGHLIPRHFINLKHQTNTLTSWQNDYTSSVLEYNNPTDYLSVSQTLKSIINNINPMSCGQTDPDRWAHRRVHTRRRSPHVQYGHGASALRSQIQKKNEAGWSEISLSKWSVCVDVWPGSEPASDRPAVYKCSSCSQSSCEEHQSLLSSLLMNFDLYRSRCKRERTSLTVLVTEWLLQSVSHSWLSAPL